MFGKNKADQVAILHFNEKFETVVDATYNSSLGGTTRLRSDPKVALFLETEARKATEFAKLPVAVFAMAMVRVVTMRQDDTVDAWQIGAQVLVHFNGNRLFGFADCCTIKNHATDNDRNYPQMMESRIIRLTKQFQLISATTLPFTMPSRSTNFSTSMFLMRLCLLQI
jgi:hypothetical protein